MELMVRPRRRANQPTRGKVYGGRGQSKGDGLETPPCSEQKLSRQTGENSKDGGEENGLTEGKRGIAETRVRRVSSINLPADSSYANRMGAATPLWASTSLIRAVNIPREPAWRKLLVVPGSPIRCRHLSKINAGGVQLPGRAYHIARHQILPVATPGLCVLRILNGTSRHPLLECRPECVTTYEASERYSANRREKSQTPNTATHINQPSTETAYRHRTIRSRIVPQPLAKFPVLPQRQERQRIHPGVRSTLASLTITLAATPKSANPVAAIRHRATEACSQPGVSLRFLPRSDHVHSDRAAAPRQVTCRKQTPNPKQCSEQQPESLRRAKTSLGSCTRRNDLACATSFRWVKPALE